MERNTNKKIERKRGALVPFFICCYLIFSSHAQNPLFIPDTLAGPVLTLTAQTGTKQFFSNTITPTFGYNGNILGPTLLLNAGDSVTLNVKNNLSQSTTVHWHGFHVAPENDGGPHQLINPGSTWSPSFKMRNEAATFWYHPHGEGKTEIQISKGLAGMIIVRDNIENTYALPRRYKIDDFPLIVQTKAFDVLYQVATANHEDTVPMVNATVKPYLQVPQQVVRLRLLNAASDRTFNFGLSDNSNFHLIASDGGLLSQPFQTNRVRLSTGERAEILVNLSTYSVGTQLYLKSFASELPRGIIGADSVGTATIVIGEGYYSNHLNGTNFDLLRLDVVAQTVNPILSIPATFAPKVPLSPVGANANRRIVFTADTITSGQAGKVDGPFLMNNTPFHMDSINVVTYLNNTEIWKLVNKTMVAHPFHIHDIEFFVLDINGIPPPPQYQGLKDVILVQPNDSVRFITKFITFANPNVPYMYHCHLLHHEDDGMMGTFLVIDPATVGLNKNDRKVEEFKVYPNPAKNQLKIELPNGGQFQLRLLNMLGELVYDSRMTDGGTIDVTSLQRGFYIIEMRSSSGAFTKKLVLD